MGRDGSRQRHGPEPAFSLSGQDERPVRLRALISLAARTTPSTARLTTSGWSRWTLWPASTTTLILPRLDMRDIRR